MSTMPAVLGEGLKKVFNRRIVFQEISFSAASGETLMISGPNGSGKSTLVKIIAGVLTPTAGTVNIHAAGGETGGHALVGLVSPYLQMFEEFSAKENLKIAMGIRGLEFEAAAADELLDRVALHSRKDDPVRTYSSGMKQRVKYAFALLHRPHILLLDEPMANLDGDGVTIVRAIMNEQRAHGILVVATNDMNDVDGYDQQVDLHAPR